MAWPSVFGHALLRRRASGGRCKHRVAVAQGDVNVGLGPAERMVTSRLTGKSKLASSRRWSRPFESTKLPGAKSAAKRVVIRAS